MNFPFEQCPRYPACSVNHCPLDPDQDHKHAFPYDMQTKCTMEKGVRTRIGKNYPDLLPMLGMTPREHASAKVWASLPRDEQERRREEQRQRLKQSLAKAVDKQAL